MTMILSVQNVTKTYDGKLVLDNLSFHMENNDKLAITGINGAGKSTLLKIICSEEEPDEGLIDVPKGIRIGYLPQIIDVQSKNTIYEEILSARPDLVNMEKELKALEERMSTHPDCVRKGDVDLPADHTSDISVKQSSEENYHELFDSYFDLRNRFADEDGYAYFSNVTGVLKGLGFGTWEFQKRIFELSGGQKTRIALARELLKNPDLLILDEPTNHLDIDSTNWLEGYLRSWKKAVIIVSHDRYFLDRIVNKVFDIEAGKGTLYVGNYSAFSGKKARDRNTRIKAYLNNQAQIKHAEDVIAKLKSFNREKSIKRAESREKALNKMAHLEKPPNINDEMKLRFSPSRISGRDVLFAEDISKSYGTNTLFHDVDLDVKRGEKIAIIGPNGAGKTTFLRILNCDTTPDTGQVWYGIKVESAYYDQEHHVLDPENTAFEEISISHPRMSGTEIRSFLASFLFTGDDVFKLVKDLSGGEQGRLSLAKLMLSKANLLFLDEPTNHLDATSSEVLEEAIRNYEGTIVYVSHDRYFINRTATRILALYREKFINYEGNYDYYLEKKADPSFDMAKAVSGNQGHEAVFIDKISPPDKPRVASNNADYEAQKDKRSRQRKTQNALNACEAKIENMEMEISRLDTEMSLSSNATDSAKLYKLSQRKEELEGLLEETYSNWEELSTALEKINDE